MTKKKLTQREIEKKIWEWSQDLSEVEDPKWWLKRASDFHIASKLIIEDYTSELKSAKETLPTSKTYIFSTITPFLFMLATTIELYLKTYLIAKGEPLKKVLKYNHKLKELRLKCLSFGDNRFNNGSLPYIADSYGKVLLESGGLRYPGRNTPPAIFPDYVDVMDELKKVVKEVVKKQTS